MPSFEFKMNVYEGGKLVREETEEFSADDRRVAETEAEDILRGRNSTPDDVVQYRYGKLSQK